MQQNGKERGSMTLPQPPGQPERAGGAPPVPPARPPLPTGDREFLPAALEILETPPSVVSVWFIWIICGLFAAILAWSYFGQLDVYAIAQGKIQPIGRSKVVQPLEAGKVRAVLVDNGAIVREGDVLIELDPTETSADEARLMQDLETTSAEAIRRRTAVEAARRSNFDVRDIPFADGTRPLIRQ